MKIVALMGSPRVGGNSDLLVREIMNAAAGQGATVKGHKVGLLRLAGCQGCFGCKQQEQCVVKDEGREILADVMDADAIVLGTPVYMWQMTGQLKLIVDRMFSFMNPDFSSKLAPGKKVVWAVAQGQTDLELFAPYFANASGMLKMVGFGDVKIVVAGGTAEKGDVLQQPEALAKARDLGEWLAQPE